MKKILITRRLLRSCEDKASKIFDAKFNSNDELHSQEKLIKLSEGCDGILSALTDKLDAETINKLPDSIKILSNFAVGFWNIDLDAAKKPQPSFPLSAAVLPVTIIVPLSLSNIFGRAICDKISNEVVLTLKFFSKSS